MKLKFNYIIRCSEKIYAFSGAWHHNTRQEIFNIVKNLPLSEKELKKRIKDDFNFTLKESNDVFTLFKKYYGIDLYDIQKSDCIENQQDYIRIFDDEELEELKKKNRCYWRFMCNYLHLCPKVATIYFHRIDKETAEDENLFWCNKINKVLLNIFGKKQKFYFSKWMHVPNPKVDMIKINN